MLNNSLKNIFIIPFEAKFYGRLYEIIHTLIRYFIS